MSNFEHLNNFPSIQEVGSEYLRRTRPELFQSNNEHLNIIESWVHTPNPFNDIELIKRLNELCDWEPISPLQCIEDCWSERYEVTQSWTVQPLQPHSRRVTAQWRTDDEFINHF